MGLKESQPVGSWEIGEYNTSYWWNVAQAKSIQTTEIMDFRSTI